MAAAKLNSESGSSPPLPASMTKVMTFYAADGLGRPVNLTVPNSRFPLIEFTTLGVGVPFFDDDETAPSWQHGYSVNGNSMAAVVAAALLCNAWKYTWCCLAEGSNGRLFRDLPLTGEGSHVLLSLMSHECDGYCFVAPWFLWNSELKDDFRIAKAQIRQSLVWSLDLKNWFGTR